MSAAIWRDVKWRSTIGMGVRQAILPTARDASARLLYIPAGQGRA